MRFLGQPSGDQRRQLAAVDLLRRVFRPDAFQVHHRRFDVAVSQPALHGADVHAVPQVVGGEGMPEFVQKEVHAVRPLGTLVVVLGHALLAVEAGALGNALDDHIHLAVGFAATIGEDKLVRCCLARLFPLSQALDQTGWERDYALLPVFRSEAPVRFRLQSDILVAKVDILPLDVADLLIAETGTKDKLEQCGFVVSCRPEHRHQLLRLVHRADGIDVVRPIALFHQARASMLLEQLQHRHYLVVDGTRTQPLLVAVSHEIEHVVSGRVLDVLLFVSGTEQGVERVAVGQMGARLALHLHIPEIGVDGIADCGLGRNLRLRFGSGNQAVADGAQLDGLAAGLVDGLVFGDGGAIAATAPAADAPLDVVGAFGVDFELAVDADPVLEPSVGFRNDGGKAPTAGGLDLLDEVDAVRVVGSVEKSAEGLESGHPKSPPLRP